MAITTETNLDYLIDSLRLHLGDIDSTSYRYLEEWLRTAIVLSVKSLQRWWNFKYLIDTDYNVYRNPNHTYLFESPPIVQNSDERPIILMASIIVKGGSLENSAWAVASWKDAEISYSNIAGGNMRDKSLDRDIAELELLMKPPVKRLAGTVKGHLPGYLNNPYERKDIDKE